MHIRTIVSALALALVAALTGGAVTASPAAAQNGSGCRGVMQLRADPWSEHAWYDVPERLLGQWITPKFIDVDVHATLGYWYCPNGRKPAKIKVKWIDWCWTMPNKEDHLLFSGVTFNSYIYDDSGRNVNMGPIKVGDDNTRQNCATQDIPASTEAWMRLKNEPRWKADFTINLYVKEDPDWQFETASGGTVNHIYPDADVAIGDWHYRIK